MNSGVPDPTLTRRDLLKAGGAAALAATLPHAAPPAAQAQTPKRGGTLRLAFVADPVTGFDPH